MERRLVPPFCLTVFLSHAIINKISKKVVANMMIVRAYLTILLPSTIIDRLV